MGPSSTAAADRDAASVARVGPGVALAGVVVGAFALYGLAASLVETPRIFYDELVYMEAAASLASGDGLSVRDEPYDYGPLYPTLIAPLHWVTSDREAAYELVKLANTLLFALAAIPIYLLARRLLSPRSSVLVAALALLIPSSVYVTVVMTESLAYLASAWAILALVAAVERPTVLRQLAALGAIGVAVLTRPQFVALYVGFLLALAVAFVVVPERRGSGVVRQVRDLWPTLLSLVAGVALFLGRPLARGDSPREALGDYDVLYRSYDLVDLAKWFVWHLSALDVYLAAIPLAVAPIVVVWWLARGRGGSEREAAFASVFLGLNLVVVAVAAAVVTYQDSPGLEIDRVHDRYLFYVVPLWLIALVAWLDGGAPRPRRLALGGAVAAIALAAVFPFHRLELEDGVKLFSAVGTALPAAFEELGGSPVVGGVLVVALCAALVGAALRRQGGVRSLAFGALAAVFVLNAVLVWGRAFVPPEADVFAGGATERRWVDVAVPEASSVTLLQSSCEDAALQRDSYILTEFFNESVDDVVRIDDHPAAARLGSDGAVVRRPGERVAADFVVAQPALRLEGERVAEGTSVGLVLWRVGGQVRVADLATVDDAGAGFCLPTS